jgi:uncharacterized membrane protein YfcA
MRFRASSIWLLAALFIGGGILGSPAGTKAAKRLSGGGRLTSVFAIVIFVVAAYMLWNSASEALASGR